MDPGPLERDAPRVEMDSRTLETLDLKPGYLEYRLLSRIFVPVKIKVKICPDM